MKKQTHGRRAKRKEDQPTLTHSSPNAPQVITSGLQPSSSLGRGFLKKEFPEMFSEEIQDTSKGFVEEYGDNGKGFRDFLLVLFLISIIAGIATVIILAVYL